MNTAINTFIISIKNRLIFRFQMFRSISRIESGKGAETKGTNISFTKLFKNFCSTTPMYTDIAMNAILFSFKKDINVLNRIEF